MNSFLFAFIAVLFSFSLQANPTRKFESYNAVNQLGLEYLRDSETPTVRAWVQQQNKKSMDFLSLDEKAQVNPLWIAVTTRSKEIAPTNSPLLYELKSGDLLYTKAGGLAMRNKAGVESMIAERVVWPSAGGASIVTEYKVSPNEQFVAVAYVKNGLDLNDWTIFEISSKKQVAGPFTVRLQDFNWALDSKGIYYSKWARVDEVKAGIFYSRNYFYSLITQKEEIAFVPPQKDSREFYGIEEGLDRDGQLVAIAYRTQSVAEMPLALYAGYKKGKGEFQVGSYQWKTIVVSKPSRFGKLLGIRNGLIYVRSSEAGNNFGIQVIDPVTMKVATVVKNDPIRVQLLAQLVGNAIYVHYYNVNSMRSEIGVFNLAGRLLSGRLLKVSEVIPRANDTGTLVGFMGGLYSDSVYLSYSETAIPPVTMKISTDRGVLQALPNTDVNFDSRKVLSSVILLPSTDRTTVPLRIFQRADVKNPKFIYYYYYGYIGMTTFSQWNRKYQAMLDLGGAVAVINARGGGDYGQKWQLVARERRQRTFDDIVIGAKYLRAKFPTSKILASGRSFGGLTTYALQTQYNSYFDAFSSVVPVASLHEFFNHGLFGFYAPDDFGVNRDSQGQLIDDVEFRNRIHEFSPLENLSKMKVLKPMITFTGESDERVGPEQGRYMTQALLNQFPAQSNQIFYYEQLQNGHNGRTEFDQEAMFAAKLISLKIEEYKPLRK